MKSIIIQSSVAYALLSLAAIGTAFAQTGNNAGLGIEEVLVTAERREANLQDVPIAVSAFSRDQLQVQQVSTIGDLQALVPNLSIHAGDANNAVVYIRGIGQIDSIAFFEPGVGIYLDDVYLGRAQGAFLDVVDVERIEVLWGPQGQAAAHLCNLIYIEVLWGPQGSLYGRNTVGVPIKYVSAMPTRELSGNVSATLGNYARRDLQATISGPLGDALSGRLSLAQMTHEGYTKNQFDGKMDADRNVNFVRGLLQFDPTDAFSLQLAADYSDSDPKRSRTPAKETAINVAIVAPHTAATTIATFPADTDPFLVNADFNRTEFTKTKGYSLNASWEVSDHLRLKSITSYRELDYGTELDLDATPLNSFGIFYFNTQDQFSQEFQFAFQGDRLSLVSGIYYYSEEGDTYDGGVFANFLIATSGDASFSTKSYAVFGQIDYDFSERASGILGFHCTEEEKDYQRLVEDFSLTTLAGMSLDPDTMAVRYARPSLLNPASADLHLGGGIGVPQPLANPDTAKFDNFSPKASLKYRWSDAISLYGTVSTGFKSGGFNGRLADGQLDPYDEETLTSFEVGIKTQGFNNRLRANIAVFYNDYDDLQVSSFEASADGSSLVSIFSNAGEAVIQGLEVEITARLSEQFTINANVGYLDADYKEFLTEGADGTATDVSDDRKLVNAPRWDTLLGFRYDLPAGGIGSFSLLADVSYRSKTYLEVNSSENLAQDGYTLLNVALVYASAEEHWQVILSGKNLSDEEYRSHAFDLSAFPGVELGYYSAPRTVIA